MDVDLEKHSINEQNVIFSDLTAMQVMYKDQNVKDLTPGTSKMTSSSSCKAHGRMFELVQGIVVIAGGCPAKGNGLASAIESSVVETKEGNTTQFVVRIAHDAPVRSAYFRSVERILDTVVDFVNGSEGAKWREIASSSKRQTSRQKVLLWDFANDVLLNEIVRHHWSGLSAMISNRVVRISKCWDAMKDVVFRTSQDHARVLEDFIQDLSSFKNRELSAEKKKRRLLYCIWMSVITLCMRSHASDELEDAWAQSVDKARRNAAKGGNFDWILDLADEGSVDVDEVDCLDEQYKSGSAKIKCPLVHILLQLARYTTAGISVTKYLLRLSSSQTKLSVKIDTVKDTQEFVLPSLLAFPTSFDEFLKLSNISHPRNWNQEFEARWKETIASNHMYVHAEIKLALFYACNPGLWPIHGVIGISRKVCFACSQFLKLLNSSDGHYKRAGPPLPFIYANGPVQPDNSWLFPILPKLYLDAHPQEKLQIQLAKRLELVVKDLLIALKWEIERMVRI